MSALLLDASVVLAAFDAEDPQHGPARELLTRRDLSLASLDLARYEVANVAIRGWREPGLVAPLQAVLDRIAADAGVLPSSAALLSEAATIAEHHRISVYDAAYVAAAEHDDIELVSCDVADLVSKSLASLPADAA